MIPFDYQPRTRIVFGPDKIDSLGALAGELGARRALVVSDPGIVKVGHAQRGLDSLAKAGIEAQLHVGEAMPHAGFGSQAPEDIFIQSQFKRFVHQHIG